MSKPIKIIHFPIRFSIESLFQFNNELDAISDWNEFTYQIDCGEPKFFPPFAILIIAMKIKHIRKKYSKSRLYFIDFENHPYLAQVGFFRMCDADFGREVGEKPSTDRFMPITRVKYEDLIQKPDDNIMKSLT
jgi:hypothetical protein